MSKVLLVSDIHANLVALDAVLKDASVHTDFQAVWSLGDAVGYGPRPNECLSRLAELDARSVVGNHELAAVGEISLDEFNPYARAAAEWTGGVLDEVSRLYIASLPRTEVIGDFTLVHGSPADPVWEYITDPLIAVRNLEHFDTAVCVCGHTHVPIAFGFSPENISTERSEPGSTVSIKDGRWLVNPGSVGQPRDGDPRASYAILDRDEMRVTFHRIEYNIEEVQRQMMEIGLPAMLIARLAIGQ